MSSKKLLLIEPFTALPQSSGGRTRIFHTIDELRKYFDLTVWSFFTNSKELSLQENWLKKINLPYQHFSTKKKQFFSFLFTGQPYWFADWRQTQVIEVLKREASHFDSVQIESTQLLYLSSFLGKSTHKIFVAYDVSTISFWRRLRNEKNLLKKFVHFLRFLEIYFYEKKYLPLFDLVIAMSEVDKKELQQLFHLKNVEVIENGINEINFLPKIKKDKTINLGLIGSFSHPPNLEAFRFCCEQILPSLEKKQIDFKFYLAGENDPKITQEIIDHSTLKNKKSISNLGFLHNLQDFYQSIDLLVAPLFAGSGTRLKILESLSFGRPVLTTEIGAEGIDLISPYLQIVSKEKENNPNTWAELIQAAHDQKIGKDDQDELNSKLSKLTWSSLMQKTLSLL